MSKITRGKGKSAEIGEKLGPMKVVRQKAADRKRLPPELEAFANSDEKRIRRPRTGKQLNDPRMVYLVPGVANRHARLVYDAEVEKIESAVDAYRENGKSDDLAKLLANAVKLGVWRGKSLTSFDAFAEGVLGLSELEARELATAGGADVDLGRPSDIEVAVAMRVQAGLLEEGRGGEVSLSDDGKEIVLTIKTDIAPEVFGAISRLVSPMNERAEFPANDDDARAPSSRAAQADEAPAADADVDATSSEDNAANEASADTDSASSAWTKRTPAKRGATAFRGQLDDNAWQPRRDDKRGARGDFGDKPRGPRRDFGDAPRGPRRDFGDAPRGPRRDFGDAPRGPRRDFGEKPRGPRRDFGDAPRGPRRDFGDAPRGPRRDFGDAPRGPRRDFGDAPRGPRRDFGDAPRGERKPFGGGERKSFGGGDRKPFGGGERKSFGGGDRKPFGGGERKSFGGGDRKPFGGGERKSFGGGDRKPFGGRDRHEGGGRPNKPRGFKR